MAPQVVWANEDHSWNDFQHATVLVTVKRPTKTEVSASDTRPPRPSKTGFDDGIFTLERDMDETYGGKGVIFHGDTFFFENGPVVFVCFCPHSMLPKKGPGRKIRCGAQESTSICGAYGLTRQDSLSRQPFFCVFLSVCSCIIKDIEGFTPYKTRK